jgi:hypothetical protein
MNLKQAKLLRDEITETTGAYCTVPLGYGPDGYFARIFRRLDTGGGVQPVDFGSREIWLIDFSEQQRKKAERMAAIERRLRRSPIEILIDQSCGYSG